MASGDTLFVLLPLGSIPTESAPATLDFIDDGSTIAGYIPVLDYAGATADEHAEWVGVMPSHYDGGGLTFEINWAPAGTVTNDVEFEVRADKNVAADLLTGVDLQSQTATNITDTPNGDANDLHVAATGAITHANAGSPAVGDYMRFRISRDYDHAANADDAQLIAVYVTET